ncbi:hypothetical protein [Streptomyces siamensis]|uniref:Uncharacterized protein n=1 Tax=Streptomyces siamensis TaxID=1274986 RepID=A0ABP9JIX4_9ACTN
MVFLGPAGQAVQQRWTAAVLTVSFEDLPPVSLNPHGSGTAVGPSLWSATAGRHVAVDSNAMRTQPTILDRDRT